LWGKVTYNFEAKVDRVLESGCEISSSAGGLDTFSSAADEGGVGAQALDIRDDAASKISTGCAGGGTG